MQMQIKRQREFWHLLKIACVSHMLLISQDLIFLYQDQHMIIPFRLLWFSVYWGGKFDHNLV